MPAAPGQSREARHILQPLYAWFTGGIGFTDVREAKALLESL
jgi:hypothetical protein